MRRRALIWIVRLSALAAAACMLAVFSIGGATIWWTASDSAERRALEQPNDPNWQYVKRLGSKALVDDTSPGLFGPFNNGDWTELCVVGGYNNPVGEFERTYGPAAVAEATRHWFARPIPVEEFDLSVIWRDGAGRVRVLYFVHGGVPETQHLARCFERAAPAETPPSRGQ